MNGIQKARRASGMTQEAAAAIIGVSIPTYIRKEKEPDRFTLREMCLLYQEMDDDAQDYMSRVLEDVKKQSFVA